MKHYLVSDDDFGDLARYMRDAERFFPCIQGIDADDKKAIGIFLNEKHVPDRVFRAFEYSWRGYVICERKRSKRNSAVRPKMQEA